MKSTSTGLTRTLLATALATSLIASLAGCGTVSDTPQRVALYGDPAPLAAATRSIVITPQTRYVNVTGGDIARFVVGQQSFAWNFDGPLEIHAFDLRATAPPGMLDHSVIAYITHDLYRAGGPRNGPHN